MTSILIVSYANTLSYAFSVEMEKRVGMALFMFLLGWFLQIYLQTVKTNDYQCIDVIGKDLYMSLCFCLLENVLFTANNVVLEQATLDTWKWRHLASGYYTFCSIAKQRKQPIFWNITERLITSTSWQFQEIFMKYLQVDGK